MTYLILDTSSDLCLLALAKDDRILAQEIIPHANLLSKILLPAIQSLLKKNNLTPQDLTSIAVGIGPGSYTGTRLGVAVGKSLSFALQIPLKPFNSLLCFIPPEKGFFAHIMPAKSGAFFLLTGFISNTNLHQNTTSLLTPEELPEHIKNADFIVCAAPSQLPDALTHKPLFPPTPNLSSLCQYLISLAPTPQEETELLYLHTPS